MCVYGSEKNTDNDLEAEQSVHPKSRNPGIAEKACFAYDEAKNEKVKYAQNKFNHKKQE